MELRCGLYQTLIAEPQELLCAFDGGKEGCLGRDVDDFGLRGPRVGRGDCGTEERTFCDLRIGREGGEFVARVLLPSLLLFLMLAFGDAAGGECVGHVVGVRGSAVRRGGDGGLHVAVEAEVG